MKQVRKMNETVTNESMITNEEREHLYLYLKSKNLYRLKKKTLKDKLLERIRKTFYRCKKNSKYL